MPYLRSIPAAIPAAVLAVAGAWPLSVAAQTAPAQTAHALAAVPAAVPPAAPTAEVFAAGNAILDTSIPFAIGAREAQQDLRSAFGWPTFQEGLVEGVYFRLDPDGYARFSPTPRLDTDVFEVICRPGTTACMGRKDRLSVYLGSTGLIEITLDGAAPGDTFHITDGLTETPVPERILMPLDAPLETLLAYGGELVVRRGAAETARLSLKGFGPVTAYLRWVAARQDYAVLPRNWPVPGAAPATATLDTGYQRAPVPAPVPAETMPYPVTPTAGVVTGGLAGFAVSQAQYEDLLARIQRLEHHLVTSPLPLAVQAAPLPAASPLAATIPPPPATPPTSDQLAYLMSVLGFDSATAAVIMQMQNGQSIPSNTGPGLVESILTQPAVLPAPVTASPVATPPSADFVALSEYLKTVTPPAP